MKNAKKGVFAIIWVERKLVSTAVLHTARFPVRSEVQWLISSLVCESVWTGVKQAVQEGRTSVWPQRRRTK